MTTTGLLGCCHFKS